MSEQEKLPLEASLEAMGYDIEELTSIDEQLKVRRSNPLICICGHPYNSHTEVGDLHSCKPSRLFCHCQYLIPVLRVQDTRDFKFKTNTYGPQHALIRGLLAHTRKGLTATWIPETYRCFSALCELRGTDSVLTPALIEFPNGFDNKGRMIRHYKNAPTSPWVRNLLDVLLCPEHLDEYRLSP